MFTSKWRTVSCSIPGTGSPDLSSDLEGFSRQWGEVNDVRHTAALQQSAARVHEYSTQFCGLRPQGWSAPGGGVLPLLRLQLQGRGSGFQAKGHQSLHVRYRSHFSLLPIVLSLLTFFLSLLVSLSACPPACLSVELSVHQSVCWIILLLKFCYYFFIYFTHQGQSNVERDDNEI